MSDKLSDCAECGMPCTPGEYHPHAACLMFKGCHDSTTVRAGLAAIREHALAASPAPAIPAHTRAWIEKLIDCFDVGDMKNIGPEDASRYVNALREMLDARSAPAISESEDALLTAARRAIPALAHAAERNPVYQRDYEELSKAIEVAARKGEKS
ncbi:hypothetical protein QZL74_14345 [Burkholderia gladioli pv. alliicola]|uniref:hypothetical protein n=1 Tax=Burkholderia gladioli TaxID=28095 RepID=UPI003D815F4D